jgi:hypothetical protein
MQIMIASSTMAAEFIAYFETSNHGIWLRNFITWLRAVDTIKLPLKLYCDNSSVVLYSNNNRSSSKSKHIDIKFLAVNERVQSRLISILIQLPVRPFFAPLTALKKELGDELRKKDTEIPLSVHWGIFI